MGTLRHLLFQKWLRNPGKANHATRKAQSGLYFIGTLKRISALLLAAAIFMGNAPSPSQDIEEQQYVYKAAFLYRFTDYIEWKDFNESEDFIFAVLGRSAITKQMRIIAVNQKVKNKKITVWEYKKPDEINFAHILFIPEDSPFPIKDVALKFNNMPVLIVTEKNSYERKDAHINFFIADNKLRFEVNLKAVNRAGIKISSQLLQHAVIVN